MFFLRNIGIFSPHIFLEMNMSDKMRPVEFGSLIKRIVSELKNENSVFGIHSQKFFKCSGNNAEPPIKMSGSLIETPFGPAAGPHTQLAQNIISAYLTGCRFFELKTVQKMDELVIDKPCIDALDEAYNVEWSQELKLTESFDEYLKAWMILHVLKELLKLSDCSERGFVFNMSVGYNLEGISSATVDTFINCIKDARSSHLFEQYKNILKEKFSGYGIDGLIDSISPHISDSVTLSTMHGCPPEDIEAIAKYLIGKKELTTYVKLNPTLLGYDKVKETLTQAGFGYIELDPASFTHDLKMQDAIPMLRRLMDFAEEHRRTFGIKLSNTLGVSNTLKRLPGDQMYMSGRSLFPLTIALAERLASEFEGKISISFSGGAAVYNIKDIIDTGIHPVTLVTDILKPGGYERFFQIAEHLKGTPPAETIDIKKLKALAGKALADSHYKKGEGRQEAAKLKKPLPAFDCYTAPCTEACPAHQNIPGYIRLTDEGKFEEAFRLIMETNPLPNITGHICDHKCMTVCTRLDYDSSVEIREIKKEAAVKGYQEYVRSTGMPDILPDAPKAAVVGAGPSGLSAAYYLRREGFDVTVFEKNERAGGTVQETIPDFRLPQEAISKDIDLIEKTGVKFIFGVENNFSVVKLKAEGYKYIYIGIGAMLPNEFELKGNGKIFDALDFLKSFRKAPGIAPGKIAAVIGGGNSAMDAARAALRLKGIEKVYIIYRRTREFMPADLEEFDNAVKEGAVFRELLLPEEFSGGVLRCRKMELADYDASGRRKVIPAEYFEDIKTDWIISAIGEHTDIDLLKDNKIVSNEDKYVRTEKTDNETRIENVYIGGNALRGPSTVIESAADGKKAAEAIALKEFGYLKSGTTPHNALSAEFEESIIKKKAQVKTSETEDCITAHCLSCDLLCNKCVEVCPNRANIAVKSGNISEGFRDKYQIIHLDAFCNECGNCATFCPYDGKPYKDKITLFLNEEDFNDSTNDGFTYGEILPEGKKISYRIKDICGEVVIDQNGEIKNKMTEVQELMKFFQIIESINKNYSYLLT